MEVDGGGGLVLKSVTSRGNNEGNEEGGNGRGGHHVENEDEASGKEMHAATDGFYKDKFINPPLINVKPLSPSALVSLTSLPKFPGSDCPLEASITSVYLDKRGEATGQQECVNLDLCLTPEQPVRAERVNIKNESSESDENEEEKGQRENKNRLEEQRDTDMNSVQALVDDVFEDIKMIPNLYTFGKIEEVRAGEDQELLLDMACEVATKDDCERGMYQQVNEQWEDERKEQNKLFDGCDEKSKEMCEEAKVDVVVGGGVTQQEDVDKEVKERRDDKGGLNECKQSQVKERTETEREEVSAAPKCAKEANGVFCGSEVANTGSTTACGIENKAFVYDQESQTPPDPSPTYGLEGSAHTGGLLLLEYEEIPGIPAQDDEDVSVLTRRKVRFSSAPIKVRKPLG